MPSTSLLDSIEETANDAPRRRMKFPNIKKIITKIKRSGGGGAIASSNAGEKEMNSSCSSAASTGAGLTLIKSLAPSAKTCQLLTGNAFGSDASNMLLSIRVKDLKRTVGFLDPFGSNILHLACYNGASAEAIDYIFKCFEPSQNVDLLIAVDKEGRTPFQLSAECICRDKIDLEEGMAVIQKLYDVYPNAIHVMDQSDQTVLDSVHSSLRHIHTQSMEYKRLLELYTFLRSLCRNAYTDKKTNWESEGYKPAMMNAYKNDDSNTVETSILSHGSVADVSRAMATVNTNTDMAWELTGCEDYNS
jgi:hypothetical protein